MKTSSKSSSDQDNGLANYLVSSAPSNDFAEDKSESMSRSHESSVSQYSERER